MEAKLAHLHRLLSGLPGTIPEGSSRYNFSPSTFSLDPEEVEEFGSEESAVNHVLEVVFCPKGRQNGPFSFCEQGPGLVGVVDVLGSVISRLPNPIILYKWVDDLTEAAVHCGATVSSNNTACVYQ